MSKEEVLALAEQARVLIDELHTERLSYSEYLTLRNAIDVLQDVVERTVKGGI